jgi:hypothetical protein
MCMGKEISTHKNWKSVSSVCYSIVKMYINLRQMWHYMRALSWWYSRKREETGASVCKLCGESSLYALRGNKTRSFSSPLLFRNPCAHCTPNAHTLDTHGDHSNECVLGLYIHIYFWAAAAASPIAYCSAALTNIILYTFYLRPPCDAVIKLFLIMVLFSISATLALHCCISDEAAGSVVFD